MLKIGQNWGKIANYTPNAQQRLAPLETQIRNVDIARKILLHLQFALRRFPARNFQ